MSDPREASTRGGLFSSPEMVVAVSAIVLSICGLFIALYEASIARRAERASVWPHVEVSASVQGAQVEIWVRNTGVGPARIRAASLTHDGTVLDDWGALMDSLQIDSTNLVSQYSLIGGRVLGVDAEREVIFGTDVRADAEDPIFKGNVDVMLCYCSVYDECWTVQLQNLMNRRRAQRSEEDDNGDADCSSLHQSDI